MFVEKGNNGSALPVVVRFANTVLTMEDGGKVHMAYSTILEGKSNPVPCVTYGEELRLEG